VGPNVKFAAQQAEDVRGMGGNPGIVGPRSVAIMETIGMSPASHFRQPHCAHSQLWLLSSGDVFTPYF
jgi:hypothetical protein